MSLDSYSELVQTLTGQALASGEALRLRVNGTSMAPLLQPGDTLLVERFCPEKVELGDLLVARRAQDLVTHRLVSRLPGGWLLKGDNFPYLDPCFQDDEILGRVIAVECPQGHINLQLPAFKAASRRVGAWGRRQARLLLVLETLRSRLPARLAVLPRRAERLVQRPFHRLVVWILKDSRPY